jgi:hypothetical protein
MSFDLKNGIQVLERTPSVLRTLLAGLSPDWTDATEGPGTWSPRIIVAHLVDAERYNWVPRARVVLEHGPSRPFPVFDRTAAEETPDDASLDALLDTFVRLREEGVAAVRSWDLADADLARGGHHPELGPVKLGQLLATWVAHDLSHVAQVSRVMAKQYRDAVGPWRTFLPIMDR